MKRKQDDFYIWAWTIIGLIVALVVGILSVWVAAKMPDVW